MSLIASHKDANVQKWLKLFQPIIDEDPSCFNKIMDLLEWEKLCSQTGYHSTESILVYGELPTPSGDEFPFENNLLQWMSSYICISQK